MYPNADCEKTQAPMDEREFRLNQERKSIFADRCSAPTQPRSDSDILAELFKYLPPNGETLPKFAAINQAAKNFAEVILQNCPPSADRSTAVNWVRTARMLANSAITLNGLSL